MNTKTDTAPETALQGATPIRQFRFGITEAVAIKTSGEAGRIIGRAQFEHSENSYQIRYKAFDGRAVEQWWGESAIEENTTGEVPAL